MKGDDKGDPALTKWLDGFNSWLLLGPVIPKTLKNGSGPWLRGTHDDVGTTKHNSAAQCQYDVTNPTNKQDHKNVALDRTLKMADRLMRAMTIHDQQLGPEGATI